MAFLVLDTNIVSYLMKGHAFGEIYRSHLRGNTLAVSFMTVAELYEGAFRGGWGYSRLNELEAELRQYIVIPYLPSHCRLWGEIRAARRTQPIAVDDAWIAVAAMAYGCPLVTHDADDFVGIPGLRLITETTA